MNYNHAFHAGNFADCMKHALLLLLLGALGRKEAGFAVLDTHAGSGAYDLSGDEASRSGEWREGIGRLQAARPEALAAYLAMVDRLGLYPGSPALIRAALRSQDRLVCCELHPEASASLARRFRGDPQVAVHRRDGYEAIKAFLPPAERRGLILIDPPFEQPGEFGRMAEALTLGLKRFAGGVFALWYPIKHRAPVRDFLADLAQRGVRDLVTAELLLRPPTDPTRLNGCGLLIANPPWRFEEEAAPVVAALVEALGEAGVAEGRVVRVAGERS